jgi:hypothetical protein
MAVLLVLVVIFQKVRTGVAKCDYTVLARNEDRVKAASNGMSVLKLAIYLNSTIFDFRRP